MEPGVNYAAEEAYVLHGPFRETFDPQNLSTVNTLIP